VSSIPALLAELYAVRCAEQDIPGGATWIAWRPPMILVKSGLVNLEDVIRWKPGGIIRIEEMDAIQFPMGTWMASPNCFGIRLWEPAREPIPQLSKPTYAQKRTQASSST